jgi:hypothetical protein
VFQSFAAANALVTAVPRRKTADILARRDADRDDAARVDHFSDLWKCFLEPETVRRIFAFRDRFERLVFGQSMINKLDESHRLKSRFFCGGSGEKVALFDSWLDALDGAHFRIRITNVLSSLMSWLCAETELPQPAELANRFLGVRAPTTAQLKLMQAIIDGWLLGYTSWSLWNFVGRRTRQAVEHGTLSIWRTQLAQCCKRITTFQEDLRQFFMRPIGEGAYMFDQQAFRSYLDRELRRLREIVSLIAALASGDATVARFDDFILCEGKAPRDLSAKIKDRLEAALPSSSFKIAIEQIT